MCLIWASRANRRPEGSSVMRFGAAVAVLAAAGCLGIGPRSLPPVQAQYNESIARTLDEQMLLNLVRLRHRENPYFLQVGSITSQLSLTATGAVSADIPLGGGGLSTTVLQPNVGLSYTVTPTVTFAPLQGTDFARALLSSVSFEVLVHLMESGWKLDQLMRVLVNRINFIPNATEMARPIPETPEFEDFIKIAEMLRALQRAHLIALDQVCLTNRGCAPEAPRPPNRAQPSAAAEKEPPEKTGEDKSGREKTWVLLIHREPGKEDLIGDVLKHLHLGPIPPCPPGEECPPLPAIPDRHGPADACREGARSARVGMASALPAADHSQYALGAERHVLPVPSHCVADRRAHPERHSGAEESL